MEIHDRRKNIDKFKDITIWIDDDSISIGNNVKALINLTEKREKEYKLKIFSWNGTFDCDFVVLESGTKLNGITREINYEVKQV